RQASHQGARGLDSNVELAFYQRQMGDVKAGKIVNFAAMDRIDRAYGNGKLLDNLLKKGLVSQDEYSQIRNHHFTLPQGLKETDLSDKKAAPSGTPKVGDVVSGFTYLGGNPNDQA